MQVYIGNKLAVVPDFKRLYDEHILGIEFLVGERKRTIPYGERFCHNLYAVEHFFTRVSHTRGSRARAVAVDVVLQLFNFGLLAIITFFVLLVKRLALLQKFIVVTRKLPNKAVFYTHDSFSNGV